MILTIEYLKKINIIIDDFNLEDIFIDFAKIRENLHGC
jgi:hypothetical protein